MGISIDRRKFLKMCCAGSCGAAVHNMLSPVNDLVAYAAPATAPALGNNPVIVICNLAGGAANTITPIYNGQFMTRFGDLAYSPAESLAINGEMGFHPSLAAFKAVYDEGHCAVLNSIGYDYVDRSHDSSTEIIFAGLSRTGDGNGAMASSQGGWGARLTSQIAGIFAGVSLDGTVNLLIGGANDGRVFSDLSGFGANRLFWDYGRNLAIDQARQQITPNSSTDELTYVHNSVANLEASYDAIKNATNITLPVTFPNTGIGNSFRDAARLIASQALGVRIVYIAQGGYDDHQNMKANFAARLLQLNAGFAAFVACAKALGFWDRVIFMNMTEFGRTFRNGAAGTDHGHAFPMFVCGGRVVGGMRNSPPNDAQIAAAPGYFHAHDIDYRAPFKAAVDAMGLDSNLVFPGYVNARELGLFA